jgi:WD40 repeat protein
MGQSRELFDGPAPARCRDGTVTVWTVPDGAQCLSVRASGQAHVVRFSPDGRTLAVAYDHGVIAFDPATGIVVNHWPVPQGRCLTYADGGAVLVAGSGTGRVLEFRSAFSAVTPAPPSPAARYFCCAVLPLAAS